MPGRKLTRLDYADRRTTRVARFLLGKVLCVQADDGYAEGVILETEAYAGPHDAASHAFGNRRTARTETMFAEGGVAYVYFCYGLHRMFNVVTGPRDLPQAVLVRAVRIIAGREVVRRRRPGVVEKDWASGPGRVCAALGIGMAHNQSDLMGESIWIEERGLHPVRREIKCLPRVGVDYAGAWALKPWRYVWDFNASAHPDAVDRSATATKNRRRKKPPVVRSGRSPIAAKE